MLLKRKLRQPSPGQPKPPLTRLKELAPEDCAKVMKLLHSHTYEQALPLVEQMFGFSCSRSALGRFFQWQQTQEALDVSEDQIAQVVAFLQESYPDWTEEKMRETASAFFTLHAMSQRDARAFASIAQLGLRSGRNRTLAERFKFDKANAARKHALNQHRLDLDRLKFEESLRRKLDVGLEALADVFKKNPEAMALYHQAREKLGDVE